MDEEEPLAFDDPQLDSDATVGGCSPVHSTPQELGSPQETAVEVHAQDRWRPSEPVGWEGCPILISVNV